MFGGITWGFAVGIIAVSEETEGAGTAGFWLFVIGMPIAILFFGFLFHRRALQNPPTAEDFMVSHVCRFVCPSSSIRGLTAFILLISALPSGQNPGESDNIPTLSEEVAEKYNQPEST